MTPFLKILGMLLLAALCTYFAWGAFSTLRWVLERAAATHLDVRLDQYVLLVLMVYIFGRVRRK